MRHTKSNGVSLPEPHFSADDLLHSLEDVLASRDAAQQGGLTMDELHERYPIPRKRLVDAVHQLQREGRLKTPWAKRMTIKGFPALVPTYQILPARKRRIRKVA